MVSQEPFHEITCYLGHGLITSVYVQVTLALFRCTTFFFISSALRYNGPFNVNKHFLGMVRYFALIFLLQLFYIAFLHFYGILRK